LTYQIPAAYGYCSDKYEIALDDSLHGLVKHTFKHLDSARFRLLYNALYKTTL